MSVLARRLRSSSWFRFLRLLPEIEPRLTAGWSAMIAVRALMPPAFTLATGALVTAVQQDAGAGVPLIVAGALFIAIHGLSPLHEAVSADLGAKVHRWLKERLLVACTKPAGVAHLESPELADEVAKARSIEFATGGPNVAQCVPAIGNNFASITGGLLQAGLLARTHWWAALVLTAAWLSTYLRIGQSAGYSTGAFVTSEVVEERRHARYVYQLAVEPPAAKEVRMFGLADWAVDRFAGHQRRIVDIYEQVRKRTRPPIRYGLTVIVGAYTVVFWALVRDALSGALALGPLVVAVQAAVGTAAIAGSYFSFWFSEASWPVPVVLELERRMDAIGALAPGTAAADGMPAREIRLQGVRFAYRPDAPPVLDDLDLVIPGGRSLAIVGTNGAGKTTLAKLLCRLYDPQGGTITIDGTELRSLDIDSWRSCLAVVFQDFVRYELPLRDNVAPRGASHDDVLGSLQAARADGLAGLDTILSKAYRDGTDLSGGQWQRVALARALNAVRQGARLVILDEPTAQLDVRGETEIFDRLLDATRGCTTILISHRFSTVRHADHIVVLENGRVVESGSHDDLMALAGRYRTMFDLQAARFTQEQSSAGA